MKNKTTLGRNKDATADVAGNLHDLESKDIDTLYIQACNTGYADVLLDENVNENVASILSQKIGAGHVAYAWDGSVSFGPYSKIQKIFDMLGWSYDLEARKSNNQEHFRDLIKQYGKRKPYGQTAYVNGIPAIQYYYDMRQEQSCGLE